MDSRGEGRYLDEQMFRYNERTDASDDGRIGISMSKIKSPPEKKRLRLALDRRNVYGENDKASRKLIPKGKQRNHMAERRSANAALFRVKGIPDEDVAVGSEIRTKEATIQVKRSGFKKRPDLSLGTVLERKSVTGTKWMMAPKAN